MHSTIDTFTDTLLLQSTGAPLILGERLAAGGEAEIFALQDDSSRAFKRYRTSSAGRRQKLEAMLRAVPEDPQRAKRNHVSICWPDDLVVAADGEIAGFVMPRLDISTHRPVALFWNPEDRALYVPGFTWKYLCVAAANLASLVELIHQKGHVIGDLNEENVLVNERALVTIVDCDSMQVRDPGTHRVFRCPVGREAFVSPEALSRDLSEFDRAASDDAWALAVLVFQMLMEGQHPTNGIGCPEERSRRIKEGLFPFLGEAGFAIPPYALPFSFLPDGLQRLFVHCFRDGHSNPAARPSAFEWRVELQRLTGSLSQCTATPQHWYPSGHATCPWCAERDRHGFDRFDARAGIAAGAQQPLPPAAAAPDPAIAAAGGGHAGATYGGVALAALAIVLGLFVIPFAFSRPSDSGQPTTVRHGVREVHDPDGGAAVGSPPGHESAPPAPTPVPVPVPEQPPESVAPPAPPAVTPSPIPAPDDFQLTPYRTAFFTIAYPSWWSVQSAANGTNMAMFFPPQYHRRLGDGRDWWDYAVTVALGPWPGGAPNLFMATRGLAQSMSDETPGLQRTKEQFIQTGWGPAMVTDLQAPTPFDYVEYTRLLTIQRPNGLALVVLQAPVSQFDGMLPLFDRVVNSLVFH